MPPRRWVYTQKTRAEESPPSPVSTTSSWTLPDQTESKDVLGPGERLLIRCADHLLHHHYKRLQAKAIQDLWSSWARLRNKLSAHAWEPLRPVYGCKGHQKSPAPGPAARGRVPH
jgi:hypothetical protein